MRLNSSAPTRPSIPTHLSTLRAPESFHDIEVAWPATLQPLKALLQPPVVASPQVGSPSSPGFLVSRGHIKGEIQEMNWFSQAVRLGPSRGFVEGLRYAHFRSLKGLGNDSNEYPAGAQLLWLLFPYPTPSAQPPCWPLLELLQALALRYYSTAWLCPLGSCDQPKWLTSLQSCSMRASIPSRVFFGAPVHGHFTGSRGFLTAIGVLSRLVHGSFTVPICSVSPGLFVKPIN